MKINEITQPSNLVTMWHGGRGLEYSYNEMLGNKSKQMEYGPGLYLTSHYNTAFKYAKGGGKTYLVSFSKGTDIEEVEFQTSFVIDFIKRYRFGNKPKLIKYILERYPEKIKASYMNNLLVNFESVTPSVSPILRKFYVDNGIDYSVTKGFAGFPGQYIVVIFNPKVIKNVEVIPANQVTLDMRELQVDLEVKF